MPAFFTDTDSFIRGSIMAKYVAIYYNNIFRKKWMPFYGNYLIDYYHSLALPVEYQWWEI